MRRKKKWDEEKDKKRNEIEKSKPVASQAASASALSPPLAIFMASNKRAALATRSLSKNKARQKTFTHVLPPKKNIKIHSEIQFIIRKKKDIKSKWEGKELGSDRGKYLFGIDKCESEKIKNKNGGTLLKG